MVEDTVPMRRLVSTALSAMGVKEIHTASNGEEGFQAFCTERPDIVIVDWHMEPVNGVELIEMIRRDETSPNPLVPIIMMTGYSALPRVITARDKGTTEFLVKPFSASDLARRLEHIINKPRDFVDAPDYFGPDRRRRRDENYDGPRKRKEDKAGET